VSKEEKGKEEGGAAPKSRPGGAREGFSFLPDDLGPGRGHLKKKKGECTNKERKRSNDLQVCLTKSPQLAITTAQRKIKELKKVVEGESRLESPTLSWGKPR